MIEQVGQQLRQARESKDLSLKQVSDVIHIRPRFLRALEEGNLGALPSAVQVRGFLRSYADFLGLDSEALLDSMHRPQQQEEEPPPEEVPEEDPRQAAAQAGFQKVETIFFEIGETIRERREILGLSLEDIEQHTHIAVHYAEMIENGQFTRFPSPVQARGMLANYAAILEMDSNAVLSRYADALQTRLEAQQTLETPQKPEPEEKTRLALPKVRIPLWLRQVVSADTLIFGIAGFAVLVITIWGIGRVISVQSALPPEPTAPSLISILNPAPTGQPSPTPSQATTPTPQFLEVDEADETQAVTPTIITSGRGEIHIFIIVKQRTYLKVSVDGAVAFEGRATPGTNLPFNGQQRIELLTGNAAALQVFYNEQDLGTLGIFGEVIDVVYTVDGAVTPTVTITPTPSEAERATPTPTATYTPEPDTDLPDQPNTPVP